jgi:3-hydroxyisobutyrate dehydrogenase-like beta-hydroxyacid dehydrogenase
MRASVIGVGHMGHALAQRLLSQGHEVVVWNRTPAKTESLVGLGATAVDDVAAAASGVDAAFISLVNDEAVIDVVLGPRGAASGIDATIVVDTSTVSPGTTRRLAQELPDGQFLAAPILGAPLAVAHGLALYLVAGPAASVGALNALWSSLTSDYRYVGADQGRATTFKVLCNYFLMTGIAALSEVVATAQRAGIDDETLQGFLAGLPVVAPALANRTQDMISGDHEGWFSAQMGVKDLNLMNELGSSLGLALPIAGFVRDRYQAMNGIGLGEADIAGVVELLREQ